MDAPGRPASMRVPPPGVNDLLGTAVLIAVGVLVAIVVVVWSGAQVAARLSGHGPVPVPLVETVGVLSRLPGHLGDPAAAWPAAARPVLPGAVLYYIGLAVPLALAGRRWAARLAALAGNSGPSPSPRHRPQRRFRPAARPAPTHRSFAAA